jgi:hypothetical protein
MAMMRLFRGRNLALRSAALLGMLTHVILRPERKMNLADLTSSSGAAGRAALVQFTSFMMLATARIQPLIRLAWQACWRLSRRWWRWCRIIRTLHLGAAHLGLKALLIPWMLHCPAVRSTSCTRLSRSGIRR